MERRARNKGSGKNRFWLRGIGWWKAGKRGAWIEGGIKTSQGGEGLVDGGEGAEEAQRQTRKLILGSSCLSKAGMSASKLEPEEELMEY